MPPSVLVTRRLPAAVLDRLRPACELDVHEGEAGLSPDELVRRVADKDALICLLTDRVSRDVLDAAPRLKVVANVAVGYDNIDVEAARARGVVVTNTPDVLTESVADLTWGLILAITRRIPEGDRFVRRGEWKGWALDFMLGSDLRGKQLGIVGFGRIGQAVAAKAPAFGMQVAVWARDAAPNRAATSGVEVLPFDQLLISSDVVSLHVPMTAETRHLIDRKALLRMKRSAYLINTSRGAVIDEDALAWGLGERLISGAALDVYEREPQVDPRLRECERVVLAPHLGSATTETRTAMAHLAARNVAAVLSGAPPLTPVCW